MTGRTLTSSVPDFISAGAILGAFAHVLPPIAAFIAIVWYLLEIYESKTVEAWRKARRRRWYRRNRALRRMTHIQGKTPSR